MTGLEEPFAFGKRLASDQKEIGRKVVTETVAIKTENSASIRPHVSGILGLTSKDFLSTGSPLWAAPANRQRFALPPARRPRKKFLEKSCRNSDEKCGQLTT